jgi:hypothetical protein
MMMKSLLASILLVLLALPALAQTPVDEVSGTPGNYTSFKLSTGYTQGNPLAFDANGFARSSGLFLDAKQFAGATADVSINACLTAAIASGITKTCDARGFAGSYTMADQIHVGDGTNAVTLLLPDKATWTFPMTGGTKCGIKQESTTSIVGSSSMLRMILSPSSGSNLKATYCTNGNGYYRARGFTVYNPGVATSASGASFLIDGAFDGSSWENIEVLDYMQTGVLITSGCCSFGFRNFTSNGNYGNSGAFANALPFDVESTNSGGSINGLFCDDCSIDHPSAGLPNIKINDAVTATARTMVHFGGLTYMEGSNNDTTTALIQLTHVASATFDHIEAKSETASSTAPVISLNGTYATALNLGAVSMALNWAAFPQTVVKNNLSGGVDVPSDSGGNLSGYRSNTDYADKLTILKGPLTTPYMDLADQSSAPSGLANVGRFYMKTDHLPYTKLNNGSETRVMTALDTIGIPGAVNITPVTATNPSAEAQLMEIALAANYLNSLNQPFFITGSGKSTNASGQTPTRTFKVKLCTVSGCGSGTVLTLATLVTAATTGSTTNNPWNISLRMVTNAIGASGTVNAGATLYDVITTNVTDAAAIYQVAPATSSSIDLTAALYLDFSITNSSSNASNTVTQSTAIVAPQSNVANSGVVTSSNWFQIGASIASTAGFGAANSTIVRKIYIPYQLTTSSWEYSVSTADNNSGAGHKYDIGLYNTAGQLLFHTGALDGTTLFPSTTSPKSVNWTVANNTIPSAFYVIAYTTDCASACAVFSGTGTTYFPYATTLSSTSTSGVLPNTLTFGADSFSNTNAPGSVLK